MDRFFDAKQILWLLVYFYLLQTCVVTSGRQLLSTNMTQTASNETSGSGEVKAVEPEKTLWQKIQEFYENKNNLAMYLVLPVLVIVYGGCSAIYCIAKCRQYCKKAKQKNMKKIVEDDDDDDNDRDSGSADDVFSSRSQVSRAASQSSVTLEKSCETPLPWQIPDDANSSLSNKNKEQSPPPPYEVWSRKGSVEEVIALSGPQKPAYPYTSETPMSKKCHKSLNSYLMAKQILRLDNENRVSRGQKKRLVFTTD